MRLVNIVSVALLSVATLQGSTGFAQSDDAVGTPRYTPWEQIPEKDITSKVRVWRDVSKEGNAPIFGQDKRIPTFTDLLIAGMRNGGLQAYSAADDRFTTKITYDELLAQMSSKALLQRNVNPANGSDAVMHGDIKDLSRLVCKYLVKEDKLTVKGKMATVIRILGIAPVVLVSDEKGETVEQPLFWIYYPDSRAFLSGFPAPVKGLTWEGVFEDRQFESVVTRESVTKL
jgi:hypothetical protein